MVDDRTYRVQTPARGFWTPLRVALVLLLLPAGWVVSQNLFPDHRHTDAAAARERLRDAAMLAVQNGEMARDNGDIYAVDVCQLATFAALAGDRELYDPLRTIILDKLLIQRVPGDPAHGMVAWRYSPDAPSGGHDASGTTEALRAAEALYHGVESFGLDEDRQTIALIIDAYARHAAVDNGVWMIRNYFNLDPAVYHYSTNSFLVDYDPDLLMRLADDFERNDWAELAQRSADLIDDARTPAGLLHQMIRPEVGTIMPHLAHGGLYSINGVEQLSNVLTVAERCTTTNPDVSRDVFDFARKRTPRLRLYYDANTGRRFGGGDDTWAGVETWGPLLRLAVKLDEPLLRKQATRQVIALSAGLPDYVRQDRLYLLGEALLALQYAVSATESESDPERTPAP